MRTILASGNVRLESSAKEATVRKKSEAALRDRFGYDAWVLAYDLETVQAIDEAYPSSARPTVSSRTSPL